MMPAPSQKELTSKHVRAMELSESADALRKKGQTREAVKLLAEAFCLEKNVAMAVDRYPARSILLKSAAVLACECLEFEEAYRLCGLILLEEKTPQFVRLEVLELLQDIQFEDQHLDLEGLSSDGHEIELALVGPGISHGRAPSDQVIGRAENLQDIVIRTSEFLENEPYRSAGGPPKRVVFRSMYLEQPRAASFAIKLSFGHQTKYAQDDLFLEPRRAMEDALRNLAMLDRGEIKEIRSYYRDSARHDEAGWKTYFRNFLSLAAPLLPDGKAVTSVGIGWRTYQEPTSILLKKRTTDLKAELKKERPKFKKRYVGILYSANSKQGKVLLETPTGEQVHLSVKEGLQDIVKRYFENLVAVEVEPEEGCDRAYIVDVDLAEVQDSGETWPAS